MTKKTDSQDLLEEIVRDYRGVAELGRLKSTVDDVRKKIRNDNSGNAREQAYEALTQGTNPVINPETIAGPRNLDIDEVKDGLDIRLNDNYEGMANKFYDNLDEIVGNLSDDMLGVLSSNKEIISRAGPEYEQLLKLRATYEHYKELVEDVEDTEKVIEILGKINEKERDEILKGSANRAAETQIRKYRAKGRTVKLQRLAAEATKRSILRGRVTRDELEEGVKYLRDQSEGVLKSVEEELGKSADDYVKGVLYSMANGSEEELDKSIRLISGAYETINS